MSCLRFRLKWLLVKAKNASRKMVFLIHTRRTNLKLSCVKQNQFCRPGMSVQCLMSEFFNWHRWVFPKKAKRPVTRRWINLFYLEQTITNPLLIQPRRIKAWERKILEPFAQPAEKPTTAKWLAIRNAGALMSQSISSSLNKPLKTNQKINACVRLAWRS